MTKNWLFKRYTLSFHWSFVLSFKQKSNCSRKIFFRGKSNSIESVWNSVNIQFKTMRGVSRKFLNSYLTEFMWRRNHTNDRFGACETIVDAIAQEYPFDSGKSIFNDFEKLEIENDYWNCLDVEDIGCVKNLSLPLYLNDDVSYDDEEVIDDLDKIIEDLATGSNISINHSFQESKPIINECENSRKQLLPQI